MALTTIIILGISFVLFRGSSSSQLNFSSYSSELLVNCPIKSLILLQRYSYFYFLFFLLSLVGTSIKYLFPLISSKYPFTSLKIRYEGFTLLIFVYFEYLIVTYPM